MPFLQFIPTASHPSPSDNHQKEHSSRQKWPSETQSVTCVPGLSTLTDLSRIVAQPPSSFHCCARSPSHHLSSLTAVSLVPALHVHPPSTPFRPYGTYPFFTHAQTISILPDLIYSLTPILFYSHLFIPNSIHY